MTLYDSVIIVVSCLFAVSFISAILLHYKNRRHLSLIESLTDELIVELQNQKDLLAHTVIKLQGERYQLLHRDIPGTNRIEPPYFEEMFRKTGELSALYMRSLVFMEDVKAGLYHE
jgi:hypothetical protein